MLIRKNKKVTTTDLVLIAMFTAVMAVCAWISIPTAVPVTMQTFGVFLTIQVLGGKRGTVAVLNYLLLGCVGVPVFSGFQGGIGSLLGMTGGYIVGFLFSALVMWGMESFVGQKKWEVICSMAVGLLVCYAFGTAWFMIMYAQNVGQVGVWAALSWCVFPYIIPDVIKLILALAVSQRVTFLLGYENLR